MKSLLWRTFWLFLALGAVLTLSYVLDRKVSETSYYSDKSLCFIEGNSLLPISPLYYPDWRIYGSVISDIIECESGGQHEGVWGDAGEYGIAQFMPGTFYWMAEMANLQNPDWYSREQQLYLLNWAEKNNLLKHWSCYAVK